MRQKDVSLKVKTIGLDYTTIVDTYPKFLVFRCSDHLVVHLIRIIIVCNENISPQ